jgi:Fe-S cluster assembly protein SufB
MQETQQEHQTQGYQQKWNSAEISSAHNEPVWLQQRRKVAQLEFEQLRLPNFKYGTTMRIDYSDLDFSMVNPQNNKEKIILPQVEDVIIMPLSEAVKKYPQHTEPYLLTLNKTKHKLTHFHRAFWTHGTFIYIPPNTSPEPIRLKRTTTNDIIHHTLIVADEGSDVRISEELSSTDNLNNSNDTKRKQQFISNATEIVIKNNAKVIFTSIQQFSPNTYNFDYKNAVTGQDGKIEWLDFCLGSQFTHSTIQNILNGTGSEGNIKGLFFGNNAQRFDIGAESIHAAPHTTSDIIGRGILNGKAKNIYRGLVKIEENAPTSNGYQKEDVLMLSKEAETNSIPQLEIDNNDVTCSHSATTTHVDDDKIFYLQSRGLDKENATRLLVEGFVEPFIKDLNEKTKQDIKQKIMEKL